MLKRFAIALTSSLVFFNTTSYAEMTTPLQAPLFKNLAPFHHPISTSEPLAQQFFDQGMVFVYGFEWSEAVRSFREATCLDPNCGMCFWGLGLALGYKNEAPLTGNEFSEARQALEKAQSLADKETPEERAYIDALSLRFQHTPKNSANSFNPFGYLSNSSNATQIEKNRYADAMKKVAETYHDDADATAIYAYAIFDKINWLFWKKDIINPDTSDVISKLESVLARDPNHVGANHYYVHVMEQSPYPETALPNAERLKTLVPLSEHLTHMPTHIFLLIGRYHDASDANLQAIRAYQNFTQACEAQGFEPETTYLFLHNYDFLRTSAAFEGRSQLALNSARIMSQLLPQEMINSDPMLQAALPTTFFVEARFGMWDALLKEPHPESKYIFANAMWHYARGMAFAHLHQFPNAKKELLALKKTRDMEKVHPILDQIVRFFKLYLARFTGDYSNTDDSNDMHSMHKKMGYPILAIATEVLTATIANEHGKERAVFSHLKAAESLQDDLSYHEPPQWYFPVREALGYAYLRWNQPEQAKAMFERVLKQYPANGWSLYGLAESEKQLGMNKEAEQTMEAFKNAWVNADVPVPYVMF